MGDLRRTLESGDLIGKRIAVTGLSFYPMTGIAYRHKRKYGDNGDAHDGSFSALPVFGTHLIVLQPTSENLHGIISIGGFFPNSIGIPEEYKVDKDSISKIQSLLFYRIESGEVSRENMSDFTVPLTSVGYYFPKNRIQINSDGIEFARWTFHCDLTQPILG